MKSSSGSHNSRCSVKKMQNYSEFVELPIETIDFIKSFLSWKDQLKLSFCRKEQFGSSLFLGTLQHQEALVYYAKKRKFKQVKDILMDPRRYPLPNEFPFGDNVRSILFPRESVGDEHLDIIKLIVTDERVDPAAQDNFAIK